MNHLGTIELKTDRLILRKFKETDAEDIFNSFINNETFLYYANKEPRSLEQERESLKGIEITYGVKVRDIKIDEELNIEENERPKYIKKILEKVSENEMER